MVRAVSGTPMTNRIHTSDVTEIRDPLSAVSLEFTKVVEKKFCVVSKVDSCKEVENVP